MIIKHSKFQIHPSMSFIHVICLHHPRNVSSSSYFIIIRSNTWPPLHYPKPNIYQFFFISTHSQCFTKGGIACLSCIFRKFLFCLFVYFNQNIVVLIVLLSVSNAVGICVQDYGYSIAASCL